MEADVEVLIGAGRHERSADRLNYRNGYRERSLDTRLGSLQLRIPKLVDSGRPVHRKAKDAKPTPDAQAEGSATGRVAADACTAGRAAPLVRQHSARPLRILRPTTQLARSERIPPKSPCHLVPLPAAAKPEGAATRVGSVQGNARTLPFATASDHPSLGDTNGMMRVTLGKSRVRKAACPDL
jgi:hypothetical protein